ncbi:MAG: dtpB [Gammaproteobacteria bacterium]|nr:dtpB [Gammaproteobacteria bacterium]
MLSHHKHPKSLWVLAFANLCDGFSYYGTMTILVLYTMHVFQFSRDESYMIYGAYAALIYSTPVLGGIIADKLLGNRRTLIFAAILAILGNFILMSSHPYGFALGLAVSVVGSGFYKSNTTHLVGTLYTNNDPRKESGYTWLYVLCNIGGTLSPLIYGFLVYKAGWNKGFLCSAIVILLSLLWFLFSKHIKLEAPEKFEVKHSKTVFIYCLISIGCLLLSLLFYVPSLITPIMLAFFAITAGSLILMVRKYQGIERQRLAALLSMSFFGMLYYATVMQVGSTITLFIQQEINSGAINIKLPASVFSTLYSLFVLVLAPLSSWTWASLRNKGIQLSAPVRLAIGILIAALGIGGFVLSSTTNYVLLGIIIGNLLLSAGDLVLMPAVYTALSNNAPTGIKNSVMGFWFLVAALGGYFSGVLSSLSHVFATKVFVQAPVYTGEFIFIAGFTALVGLGVLCFSSKIKKVLL